MYKYSAPTNMMFKPIANITKNVISQVKTGYVNAFGTAADIKHSEPKQKPNQEIKPEIVVEASVITPVAKVKPRDSFDFSQKNLQEAIIWSEILGKPVCKRRKRRYYGD